MDLDVSEAGACIQNENAGPQDHGGVLRCRDESYGIEHIGSVAIGDCVTRAPGS